MIINAIRFRPVGEDTWHAFKLNLGAGRFRNYQAVVGDPGTLRHLVHALDYVLSGKEPDLPFEAQAQLSDDSGHTWTVQRRPGFVRYMKNGQALEATEAETALAAALMDLDGMDPGLSLKSVTLQRFDINAVEGKLSLRPFGAGDSPLQSLRHVAESQIVDVAAECARQLNMTELADPRRLTRLTRRLEPLNVQYRELCRQYKDLGGSDAIPSEADLRQLERLTSELELGEEIADIALPFLAPGAPTLKAMKEELTKTDADIAETTQALGLAAMEGPAPTRDFRKAIEALARLEAHAKLVRASQGTRKYCEQNIEPLYKSYFAQAESSLAGDRQIASELESCLASLTLRLRIRPDAPSYDASEAQGVGIKTWFDRFKSRHVDDGRKTDVPEVDTHADLETARMAIEYALGRLSELGRNLDQAHSKHEGVRGKLDEGHEELIRGYSRLRDHWLQVAREAQLPDELDLNGLLTIVAGHGKLVALVDLRQDLTGKIRRQSTRMGQLSRLVLDWRKATGSQKHTDLTNAQALLEEARDVVRYLDPKKKKFEQLKAASAEARAALAIRSHLKARRTTIVTEWSAACKDEGVSGLEIQHAGLPELFQRAGLIRALAVVHASAGKATPEQIFGSATEAQAATVYLWAKQTTSPEERLELLNQLEAAEGGELRLILLADEGMGALLGTLGVGMAVKLKAPVAPKIEAPTATPQPERPAARPAAIIIDPARGPAAKGPQRHDALLTERALRTLDLLNTKPRR